MPGLSAVLYFFLGIERTERDEKYIEYLLSLSSAHDFITLLPADAKLNQPFPVFTAIESIEQYKQRFG